MNFIAPVLRYFNSITDNTAKCIDSALGRKNSTLSPFFARARKTTKKTTRFGRFGQSPKPHVVHVKTKAEDYGSMHPAPLDGNWEAPRAPPKAPADGQTQTRIIVKSDWTGKSSNTLLAGELPMSSEARVFDNFGGIYAAVFVGSHQINVPPPASSVYSTQSNPPEELFNADTTSDHCHPEMRELALQEEEAFQQPAQCQPALWFGAHKGGALIGMFTQKKVLGENQQISTAVDLMEFKPTGQLVVTKTLRMRKNTSGKLVEHNEVFILKSVLKPHPNIISYFGCDVGPDCYRQNPLCYLIMEFCSGGDLHGFLSDWRRSKPQGMIPSMFLLHVFKSMTLALAYLHYGLTVENGELTEDPGWVPLVHRDIKPANIFLRWPEERAAPYDMPEVVLGDFGFCVPLSQSAQDGLCGTDGWMPPEVENAWDVIDQYETSTAISNRPSLSEYWHAKNAAKEGLWTPAGDVYALGLVMAELATLSRRRPASRILECENWGHASDEGMDPALWDFLKSMLEHEPSNRIDTVALADLTPDVEKEIGCLYQRGHRMPLGSFRRYGESSENDDLFDPLIPSLTSTFGHRPSSAVSIQPSTRSTRPPISDADIPDADWMAYTLTRFPRPPLSHVEKSARSIRPCTPTQVARAPPSDVSISAVEMRPAPLRIREEASVSIPLRRTAVTRSTQHNQRCRST